MLLHRQLCEESYTYINNINVSERDISRFDVAASNESEINYSILVKKKVFTHTESVAFSSALSHIGIEQKNFISFQFTLSVSNLKMCGKQEKKL